MVEELCGWGVVWLRSCVVECEELFAECKTLFGWGDKRVQTRSVWMCLYGWV